MASLLLAAGPTPAQSLNLSSFSRISSPQSQTLGTSFSVSTSSLSLSAASSPSIPHVYCGRGDKKTKRGKRFNHSFGNARPRDKKKGRGPLRVPVPPSPLRKDKFDDASRAFGNFYDNDNSLTTKSAVAMVALTGQVLLMVPRLANQTHLQDM